ncbi:MAG: AAA family ATPase [Acidobacteriaceae bacterium]|nr:AAA family ATPase [Acidobacteriaceae bacterium]
MKFNVVQPYSTFTNGKPTPIPFIIDGLLVEGGFSVLAGPPKMGKSQLTRYEAVAVSRGLPFLGRATKQSEVVLINLEDAPQHVDNCLSALGWDGANDARIHVVNQVYSNVEDNVACLGDLLSGLPDVGLVIIDTLPKFTHIRDVNEYMETIKATQNITQLLRERFPHVHVQATAHTKKTKTDDVHEGILGSTALRGQTDCNIVLHKDDGDRYIAAETRIGRSLSSTLLLSDVEEYEGVDVVTSYSLGDTLDERREQMKANVVRKNHTGMIDRIVEHMRSQPNLTDLRADVLAAVKGQNQKKIKTLESMISNGVLIESGVKGSPTNPQTLRLDESKLFLARDFMVYDELQQSEVAQ